MLKNKIILIILILLFCVSGDESTTSVKIDKNRFLFSTTNLIESKEKNLEVQAMLFSNRTTTNFENLLELLKVTISPDNKNLAFEMIDRKFYMVYYHFRNKSDRNLKVDVNQYKLVLDDSLLDPIYPEKVYDGHYVLNIRGTIKNIYNLSVFSIVAGIFVGAAAICLKENKCEHVEKSLQILNAVSSTSEKNMKDNFSNPFHEYKLDFENDLTPVLRLKPLEEKTGILFYERDLEMIHSALKLVQISKDKKIVLKAY